MHAVLSQRVQGRRPARASGRPGCHGGIGAPCGRSGRPHRRLRSGRPRPRCTVGRLPRHQDPNRRAEAGPARAGPGRRRCLPYRRDVQRLRVRRAPGQGGVLGQRNGLLEAGSQGPDEDRPQREDPGRRGRPVRVPARDRQPGARARLLPGGHARVLHQAGAALQPSRQERRGRRFRRLPGDGHPAAHGARPSRPGGNGPGPLRRRLRWRAQQRPAIDWPLRWWATWPIRRGASWMCWRSPTSRTSASSR